MELGSPGPVVSPQPAGLSGLFSATEEGTKVSQNGPHCKKGGRGEWHSLKWTVHFRYSS